MKLECCIEILYHSYFSNMATAWCHVLPNDSLSLLFYVYFYWKSKSLARLREIFEIEVILSGQKCYKYYMCSVVVLICGCWTKPSCTEWVKNCKACRVTDLLLNVNVLYSVKLSAAVHFPILCNVGFLRTMTMGVFWSTQGEKVL